MQKERRLLVFVSITLMFTFVRDLLFPWHESVSLQLNLISFLIRGGMVVGLVGLTIQIARGPESEAADPVWKVWSGLGFGAALGLLVLQLGGASTGSAPVRTSAVALEATPTITPAPGINYNQLFANMHLIGAKPECSFKAMEANSTAWVRDHDADAYHPQKITRADLHDYNAKMSELLEMIDRTLKDIQASENPKEAAGEWQANRAAVSIRFEQTKLLEANWDEWHLSGMQPTAGDPKPWQKEAVRLQHEIDTARKEGETSTKEVRLL
jgi:hypothetical protein